MARQRLYWWLETTGSINNKQADFRVGTDDQFFRLSQTILDGLKEGNHTTSVFTDLKQAYHRVWP